MLNSTSRKQKEKKKTIDFLFRLSFYSEQIIEYENRIRQFSTPDKVFRYFATIQVPHPHGDYEVFMTPVDFLTSTLNNLYEFK